MYIFIPPEALILCFVPLWHRTWSAREPLLIKCCSLPLRSVGIHKGQQKHLWACSSITHHHWAVDTCVPRGPRDFMFGEGKRCKAKKPLGANAVKLCLMCWLVSLIKINAWITCNLKTVSYINFTTAPSWFKIRQSSSEFLNNFVFDHKSHSDWHRGKITSVCIHASSHVLSVHSEWYTQIWIHPLFT